MLGLDSVDSVAHVIQVALTPVFLLSGIASLLGVLSTRLARVADRVDALAEQLEAGGPVDGRRLRLRLAYLRRRSHVLDAAVMMGTLGGVATSCAGSLLFVGTLRDRPGVALFVAFGLAVGRDEGIDVNESVQSRERLFRHTSYDHARIAVTDKPHKGVPHGRGARNRRLPSIG
jgi:hypothetical protein